MASAKTLTMPDGTPIRLKDQDLRNITSNPFSDSATYAVDEYCIYNDKLYKCVTAITTAGAWDATKWEQTQIGAEFTEINTNLTNLHINPYSLITSQQVSTTEATYNTYDSRKFSDYDLLVFAFTNGTDDIRDSKVYPAIEWTSGKQIVFQTLHGSSASSASSYNVSGLVIKYNSDTSVKASGGGANVINNFRIFGVKLGVR